MLHSFAILRIVCSDYPCVQRGREIAQGNLQVLYCHDPCGNTLRKKGTKGK